MVDAVHVDRDQNRLQPPLQPQRQANVAVLDGFDDEYCEPVSQGDNRWYIEQDYRQPEDTRAKKMLAIGCKRTEVVTSTSGSE